MKNGVRHHAHAVTHQLHISIPNFWKVDNFYLLRELLLGMVIYKFNDKGAGI